MHVIFSKISLEKKFKVFKKELLIVFVPRAVVVCVLDWSVAEPSGGPNTVLQG